MKVIITALNVTALVMLRLNNGMGRVIIHPLLFLRVKYIVYYEKIKKHRVHTVEYVVIKVSKTQRWVCVVNAVEYGLLK